MYLEFIDWTVIFIYGLLVILLGLKLGKTNDTQEDYFVGGRNFK
jgi:Na+/proline symporter